MQLTKCGDRRSPLVSPGPHPSWPRSWSFLLIAGQCKAGFVPGIFERRKLQLRCSSQRPFPFAIGSFLLLLQAWLQGAVSEDGKWWEEWGSVSWQLKTTHLFDGQTLSRRKKRGAR